MSGGRFDTEPGGAAKHIEWEGQWRRTGEDTGSANFWEYHRDGTPMGQGIGVPLAIEETIIDAARRALLAECFWCTQPEDAREHNGTVTAVEHEGTDGLGNYLVYAHRYESLANAARSVRRNQVHQFPEVQPGDRITASWPDGAPIPEGWSEDRVDGHRIIARIAQ